MFKSKGEFQHHGALKFSGCTKWEAYDRKDKRLGTDAIEESSYIHKYFFFMG